MKNILGIQTSIGSDFRTKEFSRQLNLFAAAGLSHVELNIPDTRLVNAQQLTGFLAEHQLVLSKLATGLSARLNNYSLSSSQTDVQEKTYSAFCHWLEFSVNAGCGIIIGFAKGRPGEGKSVATYNFCAMTEKLLPAIIASGVTVYIEATNRYESDVANSLDEAAQIVQQFNVPQLKVLPDTFHMNIEEVDIETSLIKHCRLIDSIHLSDNNRFFPGLGGFDFIRFFSSIKKMNYLGSFAIEGNIHVSLENDVKTSTQFLQLNFSSVKRC